MSDHESKNGSTPNPLEEWSKLGQDLLGAGRKMFGELFKTAAGSLTSSSTPMPPASESQPPSSNGSSPTLSETDEKDGSSSTSSSTASDSSATSNGSDGPQAFHIAKPNPWHSRDREVTLIVHYQTHGNDEQVTEDARRLLRKLEVAGVTIIAARCNDTDIEPASAS